jgi:hypothetical protein
MAEQPSSDFDDDLMWFLTCGGSAMGERGTLGGIVAALEHGGQLGGVPNTDLYSDQQVGWGKSVYGDIEKHRWLTAAWLALSPGTQGVLLARYTAPRAQYRGDDGYGATDRYVEGSDHSVTTGKGTRTGTALLLGDLAGLAFALSESPEALFIACKDPAPVKLNKAGLTVVDRDAEKERRKLRGKALKLAESASAAAHIEWAESKAGADPMRKRSERRTVAGPYVPTEAVGE